MELNRFEKNDLIIKLHNKGKSIREIAQEASVAFRDIGKFIKQHEKEKIINSYPRTHRKTKKISKNCRAFALFLKGKGPIETAIELDIDSKRTEKLFTDYLKLDNMQDLYKVYSQNKDHLTRILKLHNVLM